MELKIALCDDDKKDLQHLKEMLYCYDPELPADCYSSATDLLDACYNGAVYDLVLLDIEMPEPNGYRIARQLADIKPEPPVIIFVTRASQYAQYSFGIAFRYLVKPISYEQFATVMDHTMRFISPRQFTFQHEGEQYIIPTKNIYYIEVIRSTAHIHCKSQTYAARLTMKQIVKALAGIDFFRVHHSYLINLRYVDHIASDNVTLITQDVIPISRANRKGFQLALQTYLRLT